MKKKMISGLLCLSMVAMLLTGCTQKETQTTTESSTTQEAASEVSETQTTEEEPVTEDVTLRQTVFGPVQGYQDTTNNALVWKGVPYAKAPIGDLRWNAPQDPDSWTDAFDATKAGNVGIQVSGGNVTGSEDCLNLDIYRPDTTETDLPVIVYIHGGNNQSGQSAEISGETLANDANCIFISLNYRLGALGFNSLPALQTGDTNEDSGNYALLDIAKALDWVSENAVAFGGDGSNVTISGFSAGGRDVMAMLISPIFEGKFQKAISFSGGMTVADSDTSAKTIAKALAPLVVEDLVKADADEAYAWLLTSDAEVKDYLYGLSADRIAAVMTNAGIRMSVFPHLYTDGTVLPEEGFATSNYNSVPLMMLTATSEFSFFASGDPYFAASAADGTLYSDETKLAEFTFAEKYGSSLYELFNAQESAQTMAANYNADIYTCTITYGENAAVVGDAMSALGAYHGVFVPLLDKNNATYQKMFAEPYATLGAQDLGNQFRAYIKNFIRSGDPNGENLTTWTKWSADAPGETLLLDADLEKATIQMTDRTISYDDILSQIDSDTSISEEAKDVILTSVLNGRWFSSKLDTYYENESLWVE